jgi:K+-sensing histidine kinase KdpD
MPAPLPSGSQRRAWLRPALGPALTLALAAALVVLQALGLKVPNPALIFTLIIVLSAFLGGTLAGLVSAAAAFAFSLWSWSVPGHAFEYQPLDLHRLGIQALTTPAMAILVGALQRRNDRQLRELQDALGRVKQLEGLISICAYCKQVRDDEGLWRRIEHYLAAHSNAEFSHGICPSCEARLEAEDRDAAARRS